jgi:SAM-dependent methyltransferase
MHQMYVTNEYQQNNPTWHEEDSPWKARQIERMVKRNGLPTDRVAEIGCGTGEILLNLERAFPDGRFSGYEIAPQAYERAVTKSTSRTSFYLEDALAADLPTFDLVLAIDVIEHVEDYLTFLRRLRPMGRYKIFHIPLDLSVQSVTRSWPILQLRSGVGHIHYFYKETALAALTDCGYTILDTTYTASRLELPNQALSSRLMRLPRRMMYALNADLTVRVLGGFSLLVLAE